MLKPHMWSQKKIKLKPHKRDNPQYSCMKLYSFIPTARTHHGMYSIMQYQLCFNARQRYPGILLAHVSSAIPAHHGTREWRHDVCLCALTTQRGHIYAVALHYTHSVRVERTLRRELGVACISGCDEISINVVDLCLRNDCSFFCQCTSKWTSGMNFCCVYSYTTIYNKYFNHSHILYSTFPISNISNTNI